MASASRSHAKGHTLNKKPGQKCEMSDYTKISFNYRKEVSDYSDLVEILFPGNRNQQHAATCILFELKWSDRLVANFNYMEKQYSISRRILQRSRAKLSRLGLVEHIGVFNMRYGGQTGWKLSSRFERALNKLAQRCAGFRDIKINSRKKEAMLIDYTDARRNTVSPYQKRFHSQNMSPKC